MKLDPRQFSQEAYGALESLSQQLDKKYHKKASALVQGLPAYISTWGLHRLSGDAKSFIGKTSEDTKYKGTVYYCFLGIFRSGYAALNGNTHGNKPLNLKLSKLEKP